MRGKLLRIRFLLSLAGLLLFCVACAPVEETAVTPTSLPTTATTNSLPEGTVVPPTATAESAVQPTATASATSTPRGTAVPPTPWIITVPVDIPPEPLPLKEEITFTVVGQLGGRVNAVALEGNIAYVGIGPRLVLVDISNPAAPRFLGQSEPLPELINAVAAQNGVAYAAGADVYVLDVSNVAAPTVISKLSDAGEMNYCYISDLIVVDDVLYAFDACPNLRAIDVSNSRQPAVRSNIHPSGVTGIALFNNTLALAEESGRLSLIDMADLNRTLGQFPITLPPLPREFASTNEFLFAVTGTDWLDCHTNSWQIINIANPTAPQLLTEIDPPNCVNDMAAAGDILLAAAGDGLRIYDVSNPSSPVLDNIFVPAAGFTDLQKIAINQNSAYLFSAAGGAAQVHTLDLSQPDSPRVVGTPLDLGPELSNEALDFSSQFAASWATGFYRQGNTLFLRVSTYEQPPHYVVAIDITQSTNPLLLGTYDWAAPIVVGNVLYTPVDGGIAVYDITNSANPLLLNTVQIDNVSAFWNTLFAWDNYLILTEGGTLYDISEPSTPQEIGQLQQLPQTLAKVNDTLYALGNDLFAIDISNLSRSPEISRFSPQSIALNSVTEMVPAGNIVYIRSSDPEAGIWALKVDTSAKPYLAGHFQHPYFGYPPLSSNGNFAVKDDLLYLAAGDFGLLIVQVEE